ncbi:MAG: helix-turn-helix transcriptional regulator [Betaproteobacteria bacterium]|nr:ArsR family transcriptional regulator [Betaproteobacteria bacterium]MBU6510954.1 ArsR family transcriptional regulator [Betaproteobacteria bacterium]MDE1954614.1 helix-turn-helix transcriptional regulator [Betaproteobacteria bacterium]MDE2151335.1 helix-turn-helix transcriptional regulator [Betaproteobacteria bacterium]MDE2479542.1 helix-turn-helix transcriptional regulator [Betaproteobacteria bacterium]
MAPITTQDVDIARVAALVGEPARAAMLLALGDGRALPAGELAACAGVSAATASEHLRLLRESGLLSMLRQGRHHYHRLASPQVGALLESLMLVAAQPPSAGPASRVAPRLQAGRTCYSHLAGRLGVGLCDALIRRDCLRIDADVARLTPQGLAFLGDFGLDTRAWERNPTSKTCIDWSERRHHLSGPLGVALLRRLEQLGWIRQDLDSRAVSLTPAGHRGLRQRFGNWPDE